MNAAQGPPGEETLRFEATDVTGTHSVVASDVSKSMPAGVVARALAHQMSLPDNVPWALRDDATSAFLEERLPIGDQLETDAKVTLTPKTHLG
jgi:hypothetical protein